ncbi:Gfo/Idh/MocA family oxidoreductase [Candidatus Bathyarchaeota archaeon]|nr:Gfo/Idh/MocA family oxidoreductase [Candidatus Bathyarchaeota archaeon]
MLNVGIIGLGHMGRLHMMNCLHVDGIKVVAAADSSKRALKKAKLVGVKNLYMDYHDLLNDSSNVNAVIISLPNFLHLESVQLALEAGLDIFVEKPLARNVKECRKIVKLVKSSGKKLMVGHCMRFIDAIEKMKVVADKGRIGNLEVVTIEQILSGPFAHGTVPAPVPEWWFDPKKTGGGALLDLGYHLIDLFRFFVGMDGKILFSCFDHKFNLPFEDGAIAILCSSDSSVKGIINVGWYQKSVFPEYNFRAILHGNAGYMSSDDLVPRNIILHAVKEGAKNFLRKVVGKKIRPLSYSYYYESYYKELQHFFECVKNDSEPSVSAMDGLKTIELIEEAYKGFGERQFT